jgi:hypothetical protein
MKSKVSRLSPEYSPKDNSLNTCTGTGVGRASLEERKL